MCVIPRGSILSFRARSGGIAYNIALPLLESCDVPISGYDSQDFDPIVNFAVEDHLASHDACSNSFAEMRLLFTDRRVLRDQHTLRLDLFDPCQGRSWFVPCDVLEDVCQILVRRRCVERFAHGPPLACWISAALVRKLANTVS